MVSRAPFAQAAGPAASPYLVQRVLRGDGCSEAAVVLLCVSVKSKRHAGTGCYPKATGLHGFQPGKQASRRGVASTKNAFRGARVVSQAGST